MKKHKKFAMLECGYTPLTSDPAGGFKKIKYIYTGHILDCPKFKCPYCGRLIKPSDYLH